MTALGVLCCFALFVCLTLLASFFLPSHLSFKNMYQCIVLESGYTLQRIVITLPVGFLHESVNIGLESGYTCIYMYVVVNCHNITCGVSSRICEYWARKWIYMYMYIHVRCSELS